MPYFILLIVSTTLLSLICAAFECFSIILIDTLFIKGFYSFGHAFCVYLVSSPLRANFPLIGCFSECFVVVTVVCTQSCSINVWTAMSDRNTTQCGCHISVTAKIKLWKLNLVFVVRNSQVIYFTIVTLKVTYLPKTVSWSDFWLSNSENFIFITK